MALVIRYHHASPRRPPSFVSRQITQRAVAIARGQQRTLALGTIDAKSGRGDAPDYTRAMLALPTTEELAIATGEGHRVGDWGEVAFAAVGLDDRQHPTTDLDLWRPAEPAPRVGKSTRARARLGRRPSCAFAELAELMVVAERTAAAES